MAQCMLPPRWRDYFYRLLWRDIYNNRMYSVLPSYLTRHYRPLARQFYIKTKIKTSLWHSVCYHGYRLNGEIILPSDMARHI